MSDTVGMSKRAGVILPVTPAIPGLWFRPYRDESDLPAMVELIRAADQANGEETVTSLDRLRVRYRNMTRIDPRQDVILAFVEDQLVAHSTIGWADTGYGERHFNSEGDVHPDWRRRGIGTAMARRNEARLLEIVADQEFDGTPVLTTWMQDRDVGARELARRRDYRQVRVFHHMLRPTLDDIAIAPLPAGLEVRTLTRIWCPLTGLRCAKRFATTSGHSTTPLRHTGPGWTVPCSTSTCRSSPSTMTRSPAASTLPSTRSRTESTSTFAAGASPSSPVVPGVGVALPRRCWGAPWRHCEIAA